jgi:CheY-like chemotaxis protein
MIPKYSPAKKTILCIDDDEAILCYEKALLERSGYAVLTAASWQQALRLVTMCHCEAVLLDYEMPGMSWHELASEIRLIRPELGIILLSGGEVPTHTRTIVDSFVPKLDVSRRLLPMIAALCNRRHHSKHKLKGA